MARPQQPETDGSEYNMEYKWSGPPDPWSIPLVHQDLPAPRQPGHSHFASSSTALGNVEADRHSHDPAHPRKPSVALMPSMDATGHTFRQHSASSSSAYSGHVAPDQKVAAGQIETSSNAHQLLAAMPRSAPELLPTRQSISSPFPPGHPLTKLATQSSLSSQGSAHPGDRSPSIYDQPSSPVSQRQFSVSSAHNEFLPAPVSPRPAGSSPSGLPSTSSAPAEEGRASPPSPRTAGAVPFIPSRSVSPIPELQQDLSSLTIDTDVPRTGAGFASGSRLSTISALSSFDVGSYGNYEVSPIEEGDVSPLEQEDLPDYQTSQEDMARVRQFENERRARELQALWMASNR